MAYLQTSDLYSRVYEEIIDEITRQDSTIPAQAISFAISAAKMYLSRFDLVALFGTDTSDPTVTDDFLKDLVKDIAVWRLTLLSNVDIDYEKTKASYDAAIKMLKTIQNGDTQPDGWPYKNTLGQTAPQGDSVVAHSYPKRRNYF